MNDENKYMEMAQRWADIVLERWIRKIQSLNIGSSGELLKSLEAHVQADARGNPAKITFFYLYYGIFTDMGVGRGVHLGEYSKTRKKKPWYSSTFKKEVHILGRLMAEKYGYDAASIPIKAFEGMTSMSYNDAAYQNLKKNGK